MKDQHPSWMLPAGAKRRPLKGGSTAPLPAKTPACFDSKEDYGKYKVLAQLTAAPGFTFCTDCTPAYRDEMAAVGRCRFPGTKFVAINGVIVGRRPK